MPRSTLSGTLQGVRLSKPEEDTLKKGTCKTLEQQILYLCYLDLSEREREDSDEKVTPTTRAEAFRLSSKMVLWLTNALNIAGDKLKNKLTIKRKPNFTKPNLLSATTASFDVTPRASIHDP